MLVHNQSIDSIDFQESICKQTTESIDDAMWKIIKPQIQQQVLQQCDPLTEHKIWVSVFEPALQLRLVRLGPIAKAVYLAVQAHTKSITPMVFVYRNVDAKDAVGYLFFPHGDWFIERER